MRRAPRDPGAGTEEVTYSTTHEKTQGSLIPRRHLLERLAVLARYCCGDDDGERFPSR